MSTRQQVSEFHIAMGQPIAETPTVPSPERVKLRLRLIAEEFAELLEATGYYEDADGCLERDQHLTFDIVEVADALADLDYVIEGARLEFGIDGEPIADAVHASNMSKLDDDGRPVKRADGKVIKSSRYQPPDIAGELRKQGWRG